MIDWPWSGLAMQSLMICALAILVAVVTSLGMPFAYPVAGGMDPSWHQALVEATDQGRIFGKDIIFTYGPFHQLFTQQVATNLAPLLAGRLISATGWAAASVLAGRKLGLGAVLAIVSATLILWSSDNYRVSEFFYPLLAILAVLISMNGRLQRVRGHRVDLALMTLVACALSIGPLAKLSMLSLFLPALLALVWWSASAGPKAVAVILTLPIVVAILMWSLVANQPLPGMPEYFSGLNTELIAGYSEAMSLPASIDRLVLLGEFIIGCAAIGFLLRTSGLPQGTTRSERLVPAIFLILIGWGTFKSSFVFDSKNHTLAAAMVSLATLVIVASMAYKNNRITKQKLSSPGPIIVLFLGMIATSNMGLRSSYKPRLNAASETLESTKETAMTLISPAKREQLSIKRQRLLRQISAQHGPLGLAEGSSIDGFNWEITSLLGQNLRYQPRPIPQSYAVYTAKLQRANATFIADPKRAPEAVVVDVADFKHRLPISPDSPALLEVLHHYNVSHRTRSGSLIFKRRAEANQGLILNSASILRELKWSRKGRVNLVTDPLPLPEGHSLVLVSLEEKTLERRLIDIIWRPMPVQIELLKRDGERMATYLMVSGAREGILIKPFVRNNDDLLLLARHQVSMMESPIAIRLTTIGFSQPFRTMRLRVEKI